MEKLNIAFGSISAIGEYELRIVSDTVYVPSVNHLHRFITLTIYIFISAIIKFENFEQRDKWIRGIGMVRQTMFFNGIADYHGDRMSIFKAKEKGKNKKTTK